MKKELIRLANHLDRIGLTKEADYLDKIIKNASKNNESNYEIVTKEISEMIFELANRWEEQSETGVKHKYKEGVFAYRIHTQKEGQFPGKYYVFMVGDSDIFDKAVVYFVENRGAGADSGIGSPLKNIVRSHLSLDETAGRDIYKAGLEEHYFKLREDN